jgi:hypothetical protein
VLENGCLAVSAITVTREVVGVFIAFFVRRWVASGKRQVFATVTSKGVWNVAKTFPAARLVPNDQIRPPKRFVPPAAYFLDAQDNLWLGYGGEWGGNVFIQRTAIH